MIALSKNAEELNQRLTRFALAPQQGKEVLIKGLLADMPRLVDSEATLQMIADMNDKQGIFQNKLTEAAATAFEVPVEIGGRLFNDWAQDYIIVALSRQGNVLGVSMQNAPEKFLHYAVSKAVCTILLNGDVEMGGDITCQSNRDYLAQLGIKVGKDVYFGGIKPVIIDGRSVCLAGGSVHLSEQLRRHLADEFMPVSQQKNDTLAGAGEITFAQATALLMQHDIREVSLDSHHAELLERLPEMIRRDPENLKLYS